MASYLQRIAASAALIMMVSLPANSQQFPNRPISIIHPFAAGGLADIIGRAVVEPLSQSLRQPVVIESRPGGNTMIAMQACARAQPDGHTICLTLGDSLSYNPYLFSKLPYDPDNDFVPITNLVMPNNLIVANATAPFSTFEEMIAYAKANPGKVTFGTWGNGSIPHVYLEMIKSHFGVELLAVPYRGAGQAFPAVIAGDIQVTYGGLGFAMPYIEAGKIKPMATTPDSSPLLPGVPTMKSLGVEPGLPTYFGVFAPAKTSPAIVEKLAAEFAKALQDPKVQELLKKQVLKPIGSSPAEFAAFVKADRMNAERVFLSMGLKKLDSQ